MKTLDEVIKVMDHVEFCCTNCKLQYDCEETECFLEDALNYLKEYRTLQTAYITAMADAEDNPPLTWDELKTMIGQPVWIDSVPLVRRWVIIKKFHPIGGNHNSFDMEVEDGAHFLRKSMGRDTGAWWQAYRKERE